MRIINKSDIRTWSNSRGEGKLFSIDMMDETGEIRATAFNAECDKFYHMIEVYLIQNQCLKSFIYIVIFRCRSARSFTFHKHN